MTKAQESATGWGARVRSWRKDIPAAIAPPDFYSYKDISAMLRHLGVAMIETGQATHLVRDRLQLIAARYTEREVRLVVLPTVLVIQIDNARTIGVEASTRTTARLDQAGQLDQVVNLAMFGAIPPCEAVDAVRAIRKLPPRFGYAVTVFGYAVSTIGLGMVINPTWAALPAFAILGTAVGLVLMVGRRFPSFAPIQPTVAALLVTVLATWFLADVADMGLLQTITPPLIALLPGLALTTGVLELTNGEVIAGASRLVYGVGQLMLLVFGLVVGTHLAGPVHPEPFSEQMGDWSFYLAVVVLAVGFFLFLSGPPGSLPWLILAVGVALIAQYLGSYVMSPAFAGAIGALLVIPLAMVASGFKTAPPGVVMTLAAFWGLVPGGLSFIKLSEAATGGPATLEALQEVGAAIFSIALGSLIGWSLYNTFTAVRRHESGRSH